jgi:4-carboxymuconolactone decarboxylase
VRLPALLPENLDPELRTVHDTIVDLVGRSMPRVVSVDAQGALIGPNPAMLHFPIFGVPALQFLAAINAKAELPRTVRETVILTVGATFNARYELYAHEIMGEAAGLSPLQIATLAAGGCPADLSDDDAIAHDIARGLATGHILPDSTYRQALDAFGRDGVGELVFLVGGYCLISMVLNCFDVPIPDFDTRAPRGPSGRHG